MMSIKIRISKKDDVEPMFPEITERAESHLNWIWNSGGRNAKRESQHLFCF